MKAIYETLKGILAWIVFIILIAVTIVYTVVRLAISILVLYPYQKSQDWIDVIESRIGNLFSR